MTRQVFRAVRLGSILIAAGGGAFVLSQALAGLVVVHTLGVVIHHMLG